MTDQPHQREKKFRAQEDNMNNEKRMVRSGGVKTERGTSKLVHFFNPPQALSVLQLAHKRTQKTRRGSSSCFG